jgi:hypothetical protein
MKRSKTGLQKELSAALLADLQDAVDVEGRSALDFLISEAQSAPPTRRTWFVEAVKALIESDEHVDGWWSALERFLVLADFNSTDIGDATESSVARARPNSASDRASVYAILDFCSKPATAETIASDTVLRDGDHLRWLDLLIPRLPKIESAQQLILQAVHAGRFSLENFIHRVDEMRILGSAQMGDWLRRFRAELKYADQPSFDSFVATAFGIANLGLAISEADARISKIEDAIAQEASPPSIMLNIERIQNIKSLAMAN